MADVTLITGDIGSNVRVGTSGDDLIYGYNPNGPQSVVSSITATRVANGLSQPLFVGAPRVARRGARAAQDTERHPRSPD